MMNKLEKLEIAYQIFSPSAPIEHIKLFAGRHQQLDLIKEVVLERGQHAVIHGQRGAGKTSLANMTGYFFENLIVSKVTCNRSDNFSSLWLKALRRIKMLATTQSVGFKKAEQQEMVSFLPPMVEMGDLKVSDLEMILDELRDMSILFIFDEYDSLRFRKSKNKMADTLKIISDNFTDITVLIVGIGENIDDLFGEHPSLERNIKQVKVPLMTEDDVKELIKNNLAIIQLGIKPEIETLISEYSFGFPNYAQLLTKFSAINALRANCSTITKEHFDIAVEQSIENSNYTLQNSYQLATKTAKQKNQFEDVVYACTLVGTRQKTFDADEIVLKLNELTKGELKKESINYNLGMLCKKERGEILEKINEAGQTRYKFKNPLMKAYIKLMIHNIK